MLGSKIKSKENILLFILIAVTVFFRLYNLGYSDYIQDETGTFFFRGKDITSTRPGFMLTEQKGPMQIVLGFIPYSIVGDYRNELAQRLPFALFSIASVLAFYFLIKKATKNTNIAFFSALLFSINGLIVAYGRIAQYQNVLFFFGFTSVYYFLDLLEKPKYFRNTLLGTFLLALALYTHWDAAYFLVPIVFIASKYLINKQVTLREKIFTVFSNFILFLVLTLPFFVPFFKVLTESNVRNVDYAAKIIGGGESFFQREDFFQFNFYNPYLTFYLYVVLGLAGSYLSRKSPIFIFWFVNVLFIFRFFISYSGLHFYNIFIPLIILAGYTLDFIYKQQGHLLSFVKYFVVPITFMFLIWQSYLLFIDPDPAYPLESEKILWLETPNYSSADNIRHKTGFPHKRYWNEINNAINTFNKSLNENLTYITNEDKGISRFYIETSMGVGPKYYAIGIKYPLSFANDYQFPQIKGKHTVHKIQNEKGETVAQIYYVDGK